MPTPPPSPLVPVPVARARAAGDRRHPGPRHRRPEGGQVGPPGHGHGPRPAGPRPVHPDPAPRPVRPRLAGPGPVRPVQRPRVDPAVLDALPDRLRADPRRPRRLPHLGQPAPRAPRGPPHRRASRSPPAPSARASPTASAWAIAERWLRTHFSPELCDHHTYVIAGDGCLEEGISHEAASLAGHLGLGRLVYVYDDNHISIDGPTELALDDDAAERFAAYGWSVDDIGDVGQRPRRARGGAAPGPGRRGPPVAHHPAQPHRLPVTAPHRLRQGPRRPLQRRGGPAHQGDPRAPRRRRPSGCPTTCWPCTARPSRAARPCGPSGRPASTAWDGDRARCDAALGGHGLPGWESDPADLHPRGRAHGHPQGHQGLPRRHRRPAARAPARECRPDRQHRAWPSPGPPPSRTRTPAAACSTTASASTPWAPS